MVVKQFLKRRVIYLFLMHSIICLLIAILLKSRAFIMGYTVSTVFVYLYANSARVSKRIKYALYSSSLILLFLLTFFFKADSSLGRILIYKISLTALRDNFFTGVGWGNFEVVYGQYQVAYFRKGGYTIKELLLADNVKYAFNDYLQLFVETGLCGLILLTLTAMSVYLLIRKAFKENVNAPVLLLMAVCQLLAIAIAAMFNHIFEKPFFQCGFIISLVICFYYSGMLRMPIYKYVLLAFFTIMGILWYHFGFYFQHYNDYRKYAEAKSLSGAGYFVESLQLYERLYPALHADVYFSTDYINALIKNEDCDKAIQVLEKLITVYNSATFYQRLAECYFQTGRLAKAEEAYLTTVYMVPNRFVSRYKVFDFYDKTGQKEKAVFTGQAILSLPVKVPSLQVTHIKEMVRDRLIDITP